MYWKCPECGAINELKKNSSEMCICGLVPYNSSEFITNLPIYVVKISARENLVAIATQLHRDVNCDFADTKRRLAAGTTYSASFDSIEAATQFADKYRRFNCTIQIEKAPTSTNASSVDYWDCPDCNRRNHTTFLRCSCGYIHSGKEERPPNSESLVCPHCEELILPDITVCPYCAEDVSIVSLSKAPIEVNSANIIVCPHCEESISEASTHCPLCAEAIGWSAGKEDIPTIEWPDLPEQLEPQGSLNKSDGVDVVKLKLSKLAQLLQHGIITQPEFELRRKQLLDDYLT